MSLISKRKATTLVELVLAIVLLNLVILTGISMELGIRRTFSSADYEVQLLDEAAPILHLVTKTICRGIGSAHNLPYNWITYDPSAGIRYDAFTIRVDSNLSGTADDSDRWVAFVWWREGADKYKLFYVADFLGGSPPAMLTDRCTNFSVNAPVNGYFNVVLELTLDPTDATTGFMNPRIHLTSGAFARSLSIG